MVFCEKPLANTLGEAERMLDAVKRAGVVHMLCHNYRRVPAVTLAKQLIDEGRIGTVRHYRGVYLQDWIVDPEFPRVWRLEKAKAGSGALGDIASHSLDLARYLVGEIAEVTGLMKTFVTERPLPGSKARAPVDVDDAALALLRFENGAIGSVEGSRFAPGRKNHNRFEINGSKGSLVWDLGRLNELELYIEEGPNSGFRQVIATDAKHPYVSAWWPPGHLIGYEHSFTHTVRDLVEAVATQKLPSPNFEDGVRNQRDARRHRAARPRPAAGKRPWTTFSPKDSARRTAVSRGTRAPASLLPWAGSSARSTAPANEALRRSQRSKRAPPSLQPSNVASTSSTSMSCASRRSQRSKASLRSTSDTNEA